MNLHRLSLAALFLVPALAAAQETPIIFNAEQTRALAITVQPLSALAATGALRLPAQVRVPPDQIAVVAAPLTGVVAKIHVAWGDTVKKGQPLLRLQGAQILEARRDHVLAESRARLASEARIRDEALFADGIIPGSRVSAARATEREAQAMLNERRQTLALSGMGAAGDAAELRAPFAGVVLEAPAEPGSRADAGTPLVRIARLEPLWLEIQANSNQAARIAVGDEIDVPGCATPARIARIAPHLSAGSQSVLLRAELKNTQGCVKPFQTLEVAVKEGKTMPGWSLPTAAMVRHRGQAWVFQETKAGFLPLAVKVQSETDSSIRVVADGLSADSRIAVHGVAAIKAAWLGLGAAGGK